MIYFEKRVYPREEMGEILKVDPKDKKFAQKVKTRLANLGFTEEDYIYTKKDITILWVPTEPKDKAIYLIRLLGIDKQVDLHSFAMFLYGLIQTDDLQAMPWQERADWLKENWGVNVSERTLRTWTSKLLDLGVLIKEKKEGKWWCSSRVNNETIRTMVETEEEMEYMREYWKDWREWKDIMPYKEVFTKLWNKYACTFYKCPEFLGCAWNEPIVEELLNVIVQYVQDYWSLQG